MAIPVVPVVEPIVPFAKPTMGPAVPFIKPSYIAIFKAFSKRQTILLVLLYYKKQ